MIEEYKKCFIFHFEAQIRWVRVACLKKACKIWSCLYKFLQWCNFIISKFGTDTTWIKCLKCFSSSFYFHFHHRFSKKSAQKLRMVIKQKFLYKNCVGCDILACHHKALVEKSGINYFAQFITQFFSFPGGINRNISWIQSKFLELTVWSLKGKKAKIETWFHNIYGRSYFSWCFEFQIFFWIWKFELK